MNIETEIEKSQNILQQLWDQVQRLHELGVNPKDQVFNIIAERSWKEESRWEVLAYMDWEQRVYADITKVEKN